MKSKTPSQELRLKPGVGFEQFVENSPIAFYTADANGYVTYFNKAATELWGREPVIGKDLWCGSWKIYYPDGSPMPLNECPMAKALKEGIAYENKNITIERPDHTFKNLLVFPKPFFDEQNQIKGTHNTLVDITELQQGKLRQATLSAIVESSGDAIISKDLGGIITSWNYGAERIFGYNEKEVIGKSITIIIPNSRLSEEKRNLAQLKKGKRIDHYETIRVTKDGRKIPISLTISPIKDVHGNIIGASKVARDISIKYKAQAEIEKHTRNLEIINSIGKSISRNMNVQVVLQRVTDATTKLTGASFGAFFYNQIDEQGESMMLFTLSGAAREDFEKFGMPRNTEVFNHTFTGKGVVRVADITKDPRYGHNSPHFGMPKGHLPVVSYLAVPVTSPSGIVIGGLFFGHPKPDVFKEEHEDMVVGIAAQAAITLDNSKLFEKVKSLSAKKDEFIALASHELKTPLTTIKGYLQLLSQKEQDKTSEFFLEKSLNQVNKLNTLIEDLLNMSRIEAGKLEFNFRTFDIRQMLLDLFETFTYSYSSHQIIADLGNDPVFIIGDQQRLEQVVINLMSNAVKYSPDADKVYLKLERIKGNVKVTIKDLGIGLTAQHQKQLFTRFYRVSQNSGVSGLGLGLYLSKQIIDGHEGKIGVSSEWEKGAEFFFLLPFQETP